MVLGGTGSIEGSTRHNMMVMGQYRSVLVDLCGTGSVWSSTGSYMMVLGQYRLVLGGTGSVQGGNG